jgi:hypothetical protein
MLVLILFIPFNSCSETGGADDRGSVGDDDVDRDTSGGVGVCWYMLNDAQS